MSWEYFSEEELKCRCGCGKADINTYFMQKLHALRKTLDFPLPISSGFRCPEYNQKVSNTGPNGPHTTGRSVDIAISGKQAFYLMQYAANFSIQGLGVKQSGPHNQRYIHLDDLTEKDGYPRPAVWSY